MLQDGSYLTVPIHGPATAVRLVEIVDGFVRVGGWSFDQQDFFKVNRLVQR